MYTFLILNLLFSKKIISDSQDFAKIILGHCQTGHLDTETVIPSLKIRIQIRA